MFGPAVSGWRGRSASRTTTTAATTRTPPAPAARNPRRPCAPSVVSRPSGQVTRKSCISPGTPLSGRAPRSTKPNSEPRTTSRTVLLTSTSPASACAQTRAPICTAMPPSFAPVVSTSPMWMPDRTSSPLARTSSVSRHAHVIASAGCSNTAKKPSPASSISRPRVLWSASRTMARYAASSARHWRSPMVAANSVEDTISVNSTVARRRPDLLALDRMAGILCSRVRNRVLTGIRTATCCGAQVSG